MKVAASVSLSVVAFALSSTQLSATSRRLSQSEHQRFLQEQDILKQELLDWKQSEAGLYALAHDLIPGGTVQFKAIESNSTSSASNDDQDAQLHRFFLTKLSIEESTKNNPQAIFSTDTPFSMMTDDEFAKYVADTNHLLPQLSFHFSDVFIRFGNHSKIRRSAVPTPGPSPTPSSTPSDSNTSTRQTSTPIRPTSASSSAVPSGSPTPSSAAPTANPSPSPNASASPAPSTPGPNNISTTHDWTTSGCVAPPRQQSGCGSCWAFASVSVLETAHCLKTGSLKTFSEQYLVSCDSGNGGCRGGHGTKALDFVKKSGGICTSESYPYVSGRSGRSETCDQSKCEKVDLTIRDVVQPAATEKDYLAALDHQPMFVAVSAGSMAFKQYKGGVITSCPSAPLNHAVVAVGYGTSTSNFYKIKNSWGTQWGDGGFMYLSRDGSTCGILNRYAVYPVL